MSFVETKLTNVEFFKTCLSEEDTETHTKNIEYNLILL